MKADKKLRVIVFATGWACRRFIKNCRDEYDILALSDWDKAKHGTKLEGYKIIDPHDIQHHNYDKIVIASQYVKEISEQLRERVGITEDRLLIPYKYQLKYGRPFLDPATRAFAREMIVYLTDLLDRYGIDAKVDYGTLLGIARDGDVIEWDDDVDLSINAEEVEKTADIIRNNRNNLPHSDALKWSAYTVKDDHGVMWSVSLTFEVREDRSGPNVFEIGIRVRKRVDGQSMAIMGSYSACPEIHFRKTDVAQLDGKPIKLPYQHEKLLEMVYGDWRTPKVYTFAEHYGGVEIQDIATHKINRNEEKLF